MASVNRRVILPVLLALVPYGILNAVYNNSAPQMAATLGLSADEAV
ncbi:MAG: hypothetical protein ACRC5A_02620 [Enterobacteriaceae bacterium]